MADVPERTAETVAAGAAHADEADVLRARIALLEDELSKMRSDVARLSRDRRPERRRPRNEEEDRVETVRNIVDRVDGEGRRVFRALVSSQMEQLRLTADLMSSFAERIERDNPADDPDPERDLPRDVMDGLLETIDRSLDIPEQTIERFEETYRQAPRTRRSHAARAE